MDSKKISGPTTDEPPPYNTASGPGPYSGAGEPPIGQQYPYNPQFAQPMLPHPQQNYVVHQQPGYFPPPQQEVVVRVMQTPNFGSSPARVICQYCQADIQTRVKFRNNMTTHILALVLCFICFPIFWIPYCCDSCKDATHECPNCERFLGERRGVEGYGRRY